MQLKFLKRNISKIVAVFCTYCLCVMPVDATVSYSVTFTRYPQQESNWCWVASAECSGKHLRYTDRTQTGAVQFIKGSVINETGSREEIALAAEYFTHNTYDYLAYNRKYSAAVFVAQLMEDYIPIATGGYYDASGVRNGGHATPVHLYYKSNDNIQTIGYYDPWEKKSFYMTYEQFCDGSRNNRMYDGIIIVKQ